MFKNSRKWLLLAFVILCVPVASKAWTHGVQSGAGNGAQLNIGGGDLAPANFINVFKPAVVNFNTPSDVSKIDDDGYLISSPAGNVGISFGNNGSIWSNTTYRLRVDPNIVFTGFSLNFAATSCSSTGGVSFTGCAGTGIVAASTNAGGTLTFTISAAITSFSMFFSSGATYSHTLGATMALYRLSDETDYLAGEIFTPEYKAVLKGLHPKTIRPMGWVQSGAANFNGETTWNYRVKPTTFTWASSRYPPGAFGGTISGTDTYTGAAAPDTPGTWTNGETYTGIFTNANTSTTPTLNINSRGAKTIVSSDALTALSAGSIAAGSIGTVVYDGILDKLLYSLVTPSGIIASIPIEAQAQLANRVNANLWATIPPWATDDYVTNWANTACSNLNSSLYLYPEYSNEVWNFGFPQTQWATQRGIVFGWGVGSNQAVYGWYGLRVRQIMGNLIPASGCSGHKLRRVLAYQAFGDITNQFNRFEGSQLCPIASGGLCAGNAAYNTFTGSANYSAAPNRPIDVTDVLSAAYYASGENLCEGGLCTPTSANAPFYQSLVTAWETPNAAAAIALVDNDVRLGTTLSQTVTASGTTFTTPSNHHFGLNAAFTGSIGASFTGTQSGTNLTASSVVGLISVGDTISGTGVAGGTTILSQTSGPTGGAGVYVTSVSGTASAASITDNSNILNVTAISSGFVEPGQFIDGTGLHFLGIEILSQQPLSGTGTYLISGSPRNVASEAITSSKSTVIRFSVSGGTAYSGIAINTLYNVTSTPLTTTFTIQPYVGGFPSGANVNAGTAGSGTVTVGATSQVPMATIASNILQFGETNAAIYDATRGSLAPLRFEQYEGAIVLQGPTAGQCTSLGITGTNCTGSIAAAIVAWKNDATSKVTQTAYFNQFMGTDATMPSTFGLVPHSRTPSQLVLPGACDGSGGLFSLLSGCLPTSTPYQIYNGFAAFSGLP